ncbi:MAG: aromatic amino acid transport family protein [Chlamydiales bacterium]
MNFSKEGHLFGGALLVAGTAIGGGMLALPVLTSAGGFFAAILIYFLCWIFMTMTALIFMEISLWSREEVNIISMAENMLGMPGRIITWFLYLFLFYSLTVVYISGGGSLVKDVLSSMGHSHIPIRISPLIFVLIFAPFVVFGAKAVDRINKILMVGLIFSFFLFLFFGFSHIKCHLLKRFDFPLALPAIPVVLTSFGFQGIVPTLTHYLGRDSLRVKKAIILGSLIPLITYILWEGLILGIIDQTGLEQAREMGQSAVSPLKMIIQSSWLYLVVEFFAFFAIVTSFLGVTLSLLDFLADGLKVKKTLLGRSLLACLIFLPPLVFAMIDPSIFLVALKYGGGFGCVLLLGLLPILMVWRGRYRLLYKSTYTLFGGRFILLLLFFFVIFELILMLVKIN